MTFTIFGGRLVPSIGTVNIVADCPIPLEDLPRNVTNAHALDLPEYRSLKPTTQRLAVVGGGPSIEQCARLIGGFQDVWAINGAWRWCADRGIAATFLSLDPHPIVAKWCAGASKALLSTQCDPAAFDVLNGADVATFTIGTGVDVPSGSSTATVVPCLSTRMGYRDITFFGCESSYPLGKTHAYQHEVRADEMVVRCNGEDYLTAPDFYKQACELAMFIRECPSRIRAIGGGLLRAMVVEPAHEVVWLSDALSKAVVVDEPPALNLQAVGMADDPAAFGLDEPKPGVFVRAA